MARVAHTLVYDCAMADAMELDELDRIAIPTLVLDNAASTDDLTGRAALVAHRLPNAAPSLPGEWHTVDVPLLASALAEFFERHE
jgi:hypothetical protein